MAKSFARIREESFPACLFPPSSYLEIKNDLAIKSTKLKVVGMIT